MQVYANSYPEKVTDLVLRDPFALAWIMGESFSELRELFNQESIAYREKADAASASGRIIAAATLASIDYLSQRRWLNKQPEYGLGRADAARVVPPNRPLTQGENSE
jgi:hypothetical protein